MAEVERFSMRALLALDKGEVEKTTKHSKSTKSANKKASKQDSGKYNVKIVDGVKYMVLK